MSTFSVTTSDTFADDELRTAFHDLVEREINAKDPAQGAQLLYSDVPEQAEFKFTFSKKLSS